MPSPRRGRRARAPCRQLARRHAHRDPRVRGRVGYGSGVVHDPGARIDRVVHLAGLPDAHRLDVAVAGLGGLGDGLRGRGDVVDDDRRRRVRDDVAFGGGAVRRLQRASRRASASRRPPRSSCRPVGSARPCRARRPEPPARRRRRRSRSPTPAPPTSPPTLGAMTAATTMTAAAAAPPIHQRPRRARFVVRSREMSANTAVSISSIRSVRQLGQRCGCRHALRSRSAPCSVLMCSPSQRSAVGCGCGRDDCGRRRARRRALRRRLGRRSPRRRTGGRCRGRAG